MSYCQLNRVKLLEKAKSRYHNGTGKTIAKYYKNEFSKEKQEISTENYLKNKRK